METLDDARPAGERLSRRRLVAGGLALTGGASLALSATGFGSVAPRLVAAQDATPVSGGTPDSAAEVGGAAVDPQMQTVLTALASFNAPPIESVTPDVARNLPSFANAVQKVLADQGKPSLEAVGSIDHALIPGPAGDLLVRLYRPKGAASGPLPVLVYFHGGGFVIANLDTYDASCRALSNAAQGIVASVAYRLAPEHPLPAAVDDAYAAVQYFLAHAGDHGGDPKKVAVGGESAGGNLATEVTLRAREKGDPQPVRQVLIYPVTTFNPKGDAAESVTTFADAKPLNAAMLKWFASYYLPKASDADQTNVSPLNASKLSGLPPATVISAEIDPLQSQGTAYATALKNAGVSVTHTIYKGVTHEFFGMGAVVDKANQAVEEVASALQATWSGSEATPATGA